MIWQHRPGPDVPRPAGDDAAAEVSQPDAPADVADRDPSTGPDLPDAGYPSTGPDLPDAGYPSTGPDLPLDRDPSAERRALVDLVIYAYDRAPGAGVRSRLVEGLAAIGVDAVRPDGKLFDPARHEAGGVEPTDDESRHCTVAETELVGFHDRGRVIRDPVVVVYRRR